MILIQIPEDLSKGIIQSQIINMAKVLAIKSSVIIIKPKDKDSGIFKECDGLNIIKSPHFSTLCSFLKSITKIYCRDFRSFYKYYILRKIFRFDYLIYYDFRGLVSEESFLRNNNKFRKQVLSVIEKNIYRKADLLGAVSNCFAEYLLRKYGFREIQVIPCGINHLCLKKRNEKLLEKPLSFVYVGGLSKWQKFDKIVTIYTQIEQKINSSFSIYTPNRLEAKKILLEYKVKNFKIETLSQNELQMKLSDYDFGFLVRDNILLNNVASPVKFLEYTSNGVIPIISDGIGDYSKLVKEKKLGIVLDRFDKISINEIHNLYNDRKIFDRLFQFSKNYLWHELLKDTRLTE